MVSLNPATGENAAVEPSDSPDGCEGERVRAEAVAQLFREHNRSLVSYLAMRLRSLQEAKEVAQEAYVRLLQLDEPGAESFLRAYLFKVATNLAVDRLRQRGRRQRYEEDVPTDELETGLEEPSRRTLAREQLGALIAGLEELPEKCRSAFLMYRLDGMSQQDIATHLGVSERMVRTYITQALVYCRLRADGATPEQAKEAAKR